MENQRVNITKRLLKEALLALLEEKPLDKVTITELCRAAEVNRATFYRHYSVPQDVLLDIEGDVIRGAQQYAPLPATPQDAREYLERLFTYIYANAPVVRTLMRTGTDANLKQMQDMCGRAILTAKLQGSGGPKPDETRLRLLSAYLGGGGYHMLRAWLMDDMPTPPEELARFIFELMKLDLDTLFSGREAGKF